MSQEFFSEDDFTIPDSLKINNLGGLFADKKVDKGWRKILKSFSKTTEYSELNHKVVEAYSSHVCHPHPSCIFKALHLTPLEDVSVVILGQDPYHGRGQADGLAFSVPRGVKTPPSLRNILKERSDDLQLPSRPTDLSDLASQGVLLLNTVLTVSSGLAASHRQWGWEVLVGELLKEVNALPHGVCFILWGKDAEKYKLLININKHVVFTSPHPSPLSSYRGFFGSRPFSRVNDALLNLGRDTINW